MAKKKHLSLSGCRLMQAFLLQVHGKEKKKTKLKKDNDLE